MNKIQFWILNLTSLALVLLLVGHFVMVKRNNLLGEALDRDRTAINNARQIETVLDQLAKRIARGSETDPQLKSILIKYGLNVTLEVDGRKKSYP